MKILLLSDVNSIHTKRWVKALSEKDLEIILFSLSPNNSDFYNNLHKVKILEGKYEAKNSVLSKLRYLNIVPQLKKLIRQLQPDIIHAHYASSYGLLGALTKTSIPYIISVWGSDIYDFPNIVPFGKNIIRYNLKKADYILSTSHVMVNEIRKYTDKPIRVTPFGVDTELFKPLCKVNTDEFIIGNVKTLHPKYGIDVLIKASAIVIKNNPNKKIRLEIYGEGPQKKELIQLVKSLRIANKVNFRGFILNNKLPEVYNSFSVAVSLSNSESFGVVAVEAMACGCPVVTSDADGFTEVVENCTTGFIVPKGNPESAAKAIQRFIDAPLLGKAMGISGRKRVLDLYDWNMNVETMLNIYNEILN
ncbi:MAG: glycosyltransferase family 4 protein [Bacteroides sp.]|nr:glycosyltransferase family 4 protein [Bacteroides sp.]